MPCPSLIAVTTSSLETTSYENFLTTFRLQFRAIASRLGVTVPGSSPAIMMTELLLQLDKPVIIIDEFDSPVITATSDHDDELAVRIRKDMNAFYSLIKSNTERIHFLFITGCTKLSGLSIFSAMNNLNDISGRAEYAGKSGYTEDELRACLEEHIRQELSLEGSPYESEEEFLHALGRYYDGYRFSSKSILRVYNPVSIGNYFSTSYTGFSNYWMSTGGLSTLAVTLARHNDLLMLVEEKAELNLQDLDTFDITMLSAPSLGRMSALSLLYYAGYLTISEVRGRDLYLDFPNTEVRNTFLSSLVRLYGNYGRNPESIASSAARAAVTGDVHGLMNTLNELYKPLTPMDLKGQKGQLVQLLFKALFIIAGVPVLTEVYTGKGRLDALVTTESHDYIFEFKVDSGTSIDAADQITTRHYDWVFRDSTKPLHLIGIDFRTEEQQIIAYTHQLYGKPGLETVSLLP